ncbi:MAG: glycosyltransferase family 8 protein [Clostridia bacterium]|nr:glycosyltransferase family 8 protein [Clostridia bacterium]
MSIQGEIPIFFSINDNYAKFLAAALCSAVQNCSSKRKYRAFIIHKGLSEENKQRLSALGTDNFSVEFFEMTESLSDIKNTISNRLRCDNYTLTIYFRLFIPMMFPQYDKGIYIDGDVIVTGDLAELFDLDLGERYLGACVDKSVEDVPLLTEYMEKAVGVPASEYFNSGVLLMNLKLLREKELHRHFLDLLNAYHFDSIAPDQDYLNAICYGNVRFLDACWNTMPNPKQAPVTDAKLIHYNLFSKPWHYDDIQYGELFWEYSRQSGYAAEAEKL